MIPWTACRRFWDDDRRTLRLCDAVIALAMGAVWWLFHAFPYVTEDEGFNYHLGLIGHVWPDCGVLWIAVVQGLRDSVAFGDMRLLTTAAALALAGAGYGMMRAMGRPVVGLWVAFGMMLGPDLLVNLHKIRPEAFIALGLAGGMFLLRALAFAPPGRLANGWRGALWFALWFGGCVALMVHMHIVGFVFVPFFWAALIFVIWQRAGRRAAWFYAVLLAGVAGLVGLGGAAPYLTAEKIRLIAERVAYAPLYPHGSGVVEKIASAMAELWRVQDDNLGPLARMFDPASLWRAALAPGKLRQYEWFLAFFAFAGAAAHLIGAVAVRVRMPDLLLRMALQIWITGSVAGLFSYMFLTNHLTNYYLGLVLPWLVVAAGSLTVSGGARWDKWGRALGWGLLIGYAALALLFTARASWPFRLGQFSALYAPIETMARGAGCTRIAVVPTEYTQPRLMAPPLDMHRQGFTSVHGYNPVELHTFMRVLGEAAVYEGRMACPQEQACRMMGPSSAGGCLVSMPVAEEGIYSYAVVSDVARPETAVQAYRRHVVNGFQKKGTIASPNYARDPLYPFDPYTQTRTTADAPPGQKIGTPNYYFGGHQIVTLYKPAAAWDAYCACSFAGGAP